MKRVWAVAVKDLLVYFSSPLVYALWAMFFFFNSWAFVQILMVLNTPVGGVEIEPVEIFFGGTIYFWLLVMILLPLITMRSISEERRLGMFEPLFTTPLSKLDFLLGKFISVNIVLFLFWLSTVVYLLLLGGKLPLHWPAVAVAFLGVVLLNFLFSAVGLFASSISANQVVSAFLSFVITIVIFTVGVFSQLIVGRARPVLEYLSVLEQFQRNFSAGVIDSGAVVYFLSLTIFFLMLAWLVLERKDRFSNLITFLLVVGILFGVNVISFRHHKKWDFSGQGFYRLSERSKVLLSDLDKDVEIYMVLTPTSRVYGWTKNLLEDYASSNPHIKVHIVDPERDLLLVKELFDRFKFNPVDSIIVVSGPKHKVISSRDLIEMDYSPVMRGEPPRPAGFKAESLLTSAILELWKSEKPLLIFSSGHGEKKVSSATPGRGLAEVVQILKSQGYEVDQRPILSLKEQTGSLLILDSPKTALLEEEKEVIEEKVLRAGKPLLILLDPGVPPGIVDWIKERFGIEVDPDLVVDPEMSVVSPANLFVTFFGVHPITKPIIGSAVLFSGACGLEVSEEEGEKAEASTQWDELALSSPASWIERDWRQRRFKYDEGKDKKGPVVLGLAGTLEGSRVVVLADSDFATTVNIRNLDNKAFLLSVVDWLLREEEKISLPPKEIRLIKLTLPARTMQALAGVSLLVLPLVPLLVGAVVVWVRRRKR